MINANDNGEVSIEIHSNSLFQSFELASLSYKKAKSSGVQNEEERKFDGLTQVLKDKIAESSSKLAQINSGLHRELVSYARKCQLTNEDVSKLNSCTTFSEF